MLLPLVNRKLNQLNAKEAVMTKKTYSAPATVEHGGATTMTLGALGTTGEGGGLLFE